MELTKTINKIAYFLLLNAFLKDCSICALKNNSSKIPPLIQPPIIMQPIVKGVFPIKPFTAFVESEVEFERLDRSGSRTKIITTDASIPTRSLCDLSHYYKIVPTS